jgi:hypothetical protein
MTRDNLARFLKALKVDKINTFCILNNVQGKLVAMSSTDDSNLTTIVQNDESFEFDEPFVIRDIDRLIKMLGLHDESINIRLKDNKLVIKDSDTVSEYVTAVRDRFKVNKIKYVPTVLGEITLSKEIIRKMVHAMKVMNDSTLVSFDLGEDSSVVTIGSANDFSNEVTFAVPSKKSNIPSISEKFYLNLQIVKALLETHVECVDAKIIIPREPAVKFEFRYEGLAANYDLLKMSV